MMNKPIKPPQALNQQQLHNGFGSSPHAGGGLNKSGFQKRDQQAQAKKDFMMKKLKSGGF